MVKANVDTALHGVWERTGVKGLAGDFYIDGSELDGVGIIYASYSCDDYSHGEAFVLFEKDGVLYEVNGSHCSCHGLEDQWDPEETSVAALRLRKRNNDALPANFDEFLDELERSMRRH